MMASSEMVSGDTAWILVSTALVLLMTPGLALFYGGMVRRKNVVSTLALCFLVMVLVILQWVIIGYTLSFGADIAGIIGGLEWLLFTGVGQDPGPYAATVPHIAFAIFQMMFAVITIAIIASAFVERVRFKAFLVFVLLWATLVYAPVAHWVWGGGFLAKLGVLDFAGGTVVHISSGIAALAVALVIGQRSGFGEQAFEPHNLPIVATGAVLLFFGWFGFNAGSALAANGLAANAFLVTAVAASAAAFSWLITGWYHNGRPSFLGMLSGLIAGLVAITPAAGYVDALSAMIIGFFAGIVGYFAVLYRSKSKIDESLDAFAIHGISGILGSLLIGVFANPKINPAITGGLISGNAYQLIAQITAVVVVLVYVFSVTLIIAKIIDKTIGLRVSKVEEYVGLDISQHREKAYA
ncbi:MAG TPA: ammonium transporter [Sulfolobales archaeon]|nr:ammonium transporter [Sulfolobales archaeon]